MYVTVDGADPGAKIHIRGRVGRILCSAGRGKRHTPYPGRPKDGDICRTCMSLHQEPRLSKLMGER